MAAREPAQKRNGQRPHPRSRVRHGRARRPAQPLEHPARAAGASLGGPIVTVRDVWNVARSARSGRLRGLMASDVSEKIMGYEWRDDPRSGPLRGKSNAILDAPARLTTSAGVLKRAARESRCAIHRPLIP